MLSMECNDHGHVLSCLGVIVSSFSVLLLRCFKPFFIMSMVYIWPFAVPGWRTVRSRWWRSLPESSVSWAVSSQSSPSSVTPTQSPPVILRSSATNSALQQSMLGILFHPSGQLLSNPSCHCSKSKLQVVLNKVYFNFFFMFSSTMSFYNMQTA